MVRWFFFPAALEKLLRLGVRVEGSHSYHLIELFKQWNVSIQTYITVDRTVAGSVSLVPSWSPE